jgi:hypothetical protein
MAKEILKNKPHIIFEDGRWHIYAHRYSIRPRCIFAVGYTIRDLWKCKLFIGSLRLPNGQLLYKAKS